MPSVCSTAPSRSTLTTSRLSCSEPGRTRPWPNLLRKAIVWRVWRRPRRWQSDRVFETKAPSAVEVQHSAGDRRTAGHWGALQQQIRKPILATKARVEITRRECGTKRVPPAGRHETAARKPGYDVCAKRTVFEVGDQEKPSVSCLLDLGQGFADIEYALAPCDPKLPPPTLDEFRPRPAHWRPDAKNARFRFAVEKRGEAVGEKVQGVGSLFPPGPCEPPRDRKPRAWLGAEAGLQTIKLCRCVLRRKLVPGPLLQDLRALARTSGRCLIGRRISPIISIRIPAISASRHVARQRAHRPPARRLLARVATNRQARAETEAPGPTISGARQRKEFEVPTLVSAARLK